jgi:hypothetical protein
MLKQACLGVVLAGGLGVLAVPACSVKPIPRPPVSVERDGGAGDGPGGGGRGDYVRPVVGACAAPPATTLPLGQPCSCHGQCASGTCVDGVCCNSACTGTCQACNVPGLMGTCSAVPAGLAPVLPGQCQAQPVGGCGLDGRCDGKGGCRNYPDGTACAPGRCAGDAVADARVCSGGACTATVGVTCAPFGCDEASDRCFARCTTEDQCAAGIPCHDGRCGKKPLGAVCDDNDECQSARCADGVCCNLACTDACESCNQVGRAGTCSPVPVGHPDPHEKCQGMDPSTCGQTGACNGMGACARYPAGTVCKPASCAGASFTPASVCDAQGTCVVGAPQTCAPYVCADGACKASCAGDGDCLAPAACAAGSCGPKGLGQPCQGNGECGSGFCVDRVCCESACLGRCVFCALAGSPGRCRNVPADALDPRAAAGVTDPARVCGDGGVGACATNGRCDGNGGCQRYPDGTICQPETCDPVGNRQSVGVCNGGACQVTSDACDPHVCNGIRCGQDCASDAGCVPPNVCDLGLRSCGKKPNGQPCAGTGAECLSGICAQGVCCATPCSGTCLSCAQTRARGVCLAVPDGTPDPAGVCIDNKPASCGTDGRCDGNGGCRRYPPGTQCSPPSCRNGVAVTASFCGDGGCPPPGSETCTPIIVCNAAGTACERTCTRDDQCLAGTKCFGGKCGLLDDGKACGDGTDCKSGVCADGVCCNVACGTSTSDCQACSRAAGAAADGVCGPREGRPCNDGNACTRADVCQGAVCQGGNPVVCAASDQCHLAGACNPATGTCSNPAKPDGQACSDNNMCTVGDACLAGVCRAGAAKPCPPGDQCLDVCDPRTGACNPPKPNGTRCNDGSACTPGQDTCQAGRCTGTPRPCPAPKPCQAPGVCAPATGMCSYAPLGDGAACDDGNRCTMVDRCLAGACKGDSPMTCPNSCKACNPATGACTGANKPAGTSCEDGNRCTTGDSCNAAGACTAGPARTCDVPECQRCDPASGMCVPRNEGMKCTDRDRCTNSETCAAGQCVAGAHTACPRPDCQRCDPTTGACNPPPATCPPIPDAGGT